MGDTHTNQNKIIYIKTIVAFYTILITKLKKHNVIINHTFVKLCIYMKTVLFLKNIIQFCDLTGWHLNKLINQ